MDFKLDRSALKIVKLGEEEPSFVYWRTRPEAERISAIEFLRKQHHGTESRLQRVYRIIKLS
jgi:hypothetical protein